MRYRSTAAAHVIAGVCILTGLLFAAPSEAQTEKMPFALMVGDDAPGLSVSKWVQGEPIDKFEPGHVYVIDFWATWCGPCVASIPHVAELYKKYQGKVTVIGMNIWQPDPGEVAPFVEKMGEKMPYTVALDVVAQGAEANTGKMAVGWMNARVSVGYRRCSSWTARARSPGSVFQWTWMNRSRKSLEGNGI